MKHPQLLNINTSCTNYDNQIAIDGLNVMRDSDQTLMSTLLATIAVDITIWDLMTGATAGTVTNKTMTYRSGIDIWTIDVSDFSSLLTDRHKYVSTISQYSASVMRSFKLNEFVVDNDSFEGVWMNLPYRVRITGAEAWIEWFEISDFTHAGGFTGTPAYVAKAYQGGTGTTYATDASRVTHRGPVLPYATPYP